MQLHILIVEDEPLIAMDLGYILEEAGHLVAGIADNMHRALEIAAEHPHLDLAIMDIGLARGTNGMETARRLRETHDVGSLFVSGLLTDQNRAMALDWKPVGFVGKPFHARQILEALQASGRN